MMKLTSQNRNPSAVLVLLCSNRAVIRTKILRGWLEPPKRPLGGGVLVDNFKCALVLFFFRTESGIALVKCQLCKGVCRRRY